MSYEMYTPYAGDAWILLLGKGELTIGKGSHQVCRRVLFLIFVRCRFQDEGRGKKQNSYHQNTGFSAINTQVVRQTLCTNIACTTICMYYLSKRVDSSWS